MAAETITQRDGHAFARLYSSHYNAVRGYARTQVAVDDVDDLVADAFVVALRRFAEIPVGHEHSWLISVTHRVAGTRRRSNHRALSFHEQLAFLRPTTTTDLSAGQLCVEDLDQLKEALAELRCDDREILGLAVWHELSVDELAAALGITSNATYVRLHRARGRFRAVLQRLQTRIDMR